MAEISVPRLLLESARQDEKAVAALSPIRDIADAIVGFHAQQAVEKALKAVLSSAGIAFAAPTTLPNCWIFLQIQACRRHQKQRF